MVEVVKGLIPTMTTSLGLFEGPRPMLPPPPPGAAPPPPPPMPPEEERRPMLQTLRVDHDGKTDLRALVKDEAPALERFFLATAHGASVPLRDLWYETITRQRYRNGHVYEVHARAAGQVPGKGESPATARFFDVLRELLAKAPGLRLESARFEDPGAGAEFRLSVALVIAGAPEGLGAVETAVRAVDGEALVQRVAAEGGGENLDVQLTLARRRRRPQ